MTTPSSKLSFRLYGHHGSICTHRVLLAFAEKGLKPDFVHVDLAKCEHKSPEHMARQPFGVIPVLEHGGTSLYESHAIVRYIDDVLAGAKLTPSDAPTRAVMEQWISVEYSYVSPHVGEIVKQKFVVPMQGGPIDMEALDGARHGCSRAFDVIDTALAGRAYLAGQAFTLADVSLAPIVGMLFVTGEGSLVQSRSNLGAWWERVSSRPSWKKVSGATVS